MKVLFVNPVLRTAETNTIPVVSSIKDCLGFTFCDSFRTSGHDITLIAAKDYLPSAPEEYPFRILFLKSWFRRLFVPRVIPFMPSLIIHLLREGRKYDLIISSELHTIHSLLCAIFMPKKLVVWHELSHHFRKFNGIPSRIFFKISGLVYRRIYSICPRSERARSFLMQYYPNVANTPIGHGVNLEKFACDDGVDETFLVCSQLIARKRIDETIEKFARYIKAFPDSTEKLYIIGDGDQRDHLVRLAGDLKMDGRIEFLGRLPHEKVIPLLARTKALLISSRLDLALLSISEALACGTPVVTHNGVDSSDLIQKHHLGISSSDWSEYDLKEVSKNSSIFKAACKTHRDLFSNESVVNSFVDLVTHPMRDPLASSKK